MPECSLKLRERTSRMLARGASFKEPRSRRPKFLKLIQLKETSLKSFITVSNEELKSWLHSFAARIRIDTFIKPLSYLYAFGLEF